MTTSERAEHVVRETILKMLSSEEIGKVSTAEAASRLDDGDEYLDLGNLDQGVQRAGAVKKIAMGQIIPRAALRAETWGKILAKLGG